MIGGGLQLAIKLKMLLLFAVDEFSKLTTRS